MTTSISAAEVGAVSAAIEMAKVPTQPLASRFRHTLASRFGFLIICVAIVLSALAYGTVHYWALALFSLGAFAILALWVCDGWSLGLLRISRNPLQLPLLG